MAKFSNPRKPLLNCYTLGNSLERNEVFFGAFPLFDPLKCNFWISSEINDEVHLEVESWTSNQVIEPFRQNRVLGVRHLALGVQVLDEAIASAVGRGTFKH